MKRTLVAAAVGLALVLPAQPAASKGIGSCIRKAAKIENTERSRVLRETARGLCHIRRSL